MAKVICIDPVKSLSGKMKKDSDVYFATNRRIGVCNAITAISKMRLPR